MSETEFYRVDLDGDKVAIPYLEIHHLKRDIVHYFDENVGETHYILMPVNIYKYDYWKYISIDFTKKWATSERYKSLIERGCLALINGIALDILYEPETNLDKTWSERRVGVEDILPYVTAYKPSSAVLEEGRSLLLKTLMSIREFEPRDIASKGDIDWSEILVTAKWFDKNIVQQYFRDQVKEWC